jgi:hypothetical protein
MRTAAETQLSEPRTDQSIQARQNLRPTDQVERIDAQRLAYETEHDDGANTDAAVRPIGKPPAPSPAPIFNIVATRQFIQPHDLPLCRFLYRSSPRLGQLRQSREPAIGGQLVDKPGQNLRQLSGEFFLREA